MRIDLLLKAVCYLKNKRSDCGVEPLCLQCLDVADKSISFSFPAQLPACSIAFFLVCPCKQADEHMLALALKKNKHCSWQAGCASPVWRRDSACWEVKISICWHVRGLQETSQCWPALCTVQNSIEKWCLNFLIILIAHPPLKCQFDTMFFLMLWKLIINKISTC